MNVHSLDLASIARALGGEINGGQVLAPGPGHSEKDRSLAIKLAPQLAEGFVVHSHAGDDAMACKDYVRSKVGLPAFAIGSATATKPTRVVVAEYVYKLADGTPYLKVQRVLKDGRKDFPQLRRDGDRWVYGKPDGPKIPYRLPELLAKPKSGVFICEGEKDADRLTSLGFVATSASEGAGKWTADLNGYFNNRSVYILADNDEAGEKHAVEVATNLSAVAKSVRIVRLPGLPPKGDVSDWLDAGNPERQVVDTIGDTLSPREDRSLVGLAKASPIFDPAAKPPITAAMVEEWRKHDKEKFQRDADNFKAKAEAAAGEPVASPFISAAALMAMTFPPVSYVVPGYIVEGLTLLAGKPKIGKSWLALDLGIAVGRGGFTLGDIKCEVGDVLYAALEDNNRRLQNRLAKLLQSQSVPDRLEFVTTMPKLDEGGIAFLRGWIESHERPRLIIIDVLNKVRRSKGDRENAYEADYKAVSDLKALADEHGVAILVLHHVRKMEADDPLDTVSGTTGLTGAVDSILVFNRTSQGTTLYGRGRDIEEIEKAAEFNRNSCRWEIKGDAEDVQRSDARNEILTAMKEAGEPMTAREVHDLCEDLTYENVRKLLRRMVATGDIRKEGRGKFCPNATSVPSVPSVPNGDEDAED